MTFCNLEKNTLPETNIFALENGWLEDDSFLLGPGLFSGAFAVSFRECTFNNTLTKLNIAYVQVDLLGKVS